MADETFGVSLEQHLANRAGLDTTPQSAWQKYVGDPTSRVAQMAVGPLQAAGQEIVQGTFNPGRVLAATGAMGWGNRQPSTPEVTEPGQAAKFINPYTTPSKAGIIAGGALGGGLAPASVVGKGLHTAATTMGMTTGGFAGGTVEGGAQGGKSVV